MSETRVSWFASITQHIPDEDVPLGTAIADIRGPAHARTIAPLRRLYQEGKEEEYRKGKNALPAFSPAATMTTREAGGVITPSGLLYYDCDKLETAQLVEARKQLQNNPSVAFIFLSPSGVGLKIGLAVEGLTVENYHDVWAYYRDMVDESGIAADSAVSSIKSMCYISSDPQAYYNEHAEPLPLRRVERKPPKPAPRRVEHPGEEDRRIQDALEAIPATDYHVWIRVGMALRAAKGYSWFDVWDAWSSRAANYNERGMHAKWNSFYGTGVGLGTIYHYAEEHGWRDPRKDKKARPVPQMYPGDTGDKGNLEDKEEEGDIEAIDNHRLIAIADVQRQAVPWLWWPYLIRGALTMLDGDPGQGKSMASLAIATHLSLGKPFPDQQGQFTLHTPVGGSIFFAKEDDLASVVRPRLEAMGADLTKIEYYQGIKEKQGFGRERFTMQDMEKLEDAVQEFMQKHGETPLFIVIDPIQAYLGKGVSMNNAADTRPLLEGLADFAHKYHCCITCIRHASKGGGVDGNLSAMMRGGGATDITGAARTVLFVQEHPQIKHQALFMHVKANSSTKGRALIFSRKDGVFQWERVTRVDAEDIAGAGRGMSPRERIKAAFWLERHLEGGVGDWSKDINVKAEEYGISEKMLYAAKSMLGVEAHKVGFGREAPFQWRLPDLAIIEPPAEVKRVEENFHPNVANNIDTPSSTTTTIDILSSIPSMGSKERMSISNTYTYTLPGDRMHSSDIRPILPPLAPARATHANTTTSEESQDLTVLEQEDDDVMIFDPKEQK